MATVSFNKPAAARKAAPVTTPATAGPNEVIEGEVVEPNSGASVTAVTTAPVAPPAVFVPRAPVTFTDDDKINFADMRLPTLKLAQSVGTLGATFEPGTLVLGDETPLADAPPRKPGADFVPQKVKLVVIGFRPQRWAEKTADGEERGQLVNTEAEVYGLGGTTNWDEAKAKGIPLFRKMDTALVLIEKPDRLDEGFDPVFPYIANEKRYAVATWSLIGAGHTSAAQPLKTWRGALRMFKDAEVPGTPSNPADRGAYRNKFVQIHSFFKVFQGGHSAFVPVVSRPVEFTSPELRAIAEEFVGNN